MCVYATSRFLHSHSFGPPARPRSGTASHIAATRPGGEDHVDWRQGPAVAIAGTAITAALVFNCLAPAECSAASVAASTPYTEARSISFGVVAGRIQTCPTAVNPNCVSTSSTNQTYSPVWRASATSAKAALLDIESVMIGSQKATKLVEADTPFGLYSAYSVAGKFDKPDIVEYLVKEDGVMDRSWEGDVAGPVVLYRSIAGDVRYIWPITQPLTDGNTQKKRMQAVRRELGWKLVGCELVECYDEEDDSQQFRLFDD